MPIPLEKLAPGPCDPARLGTGPTQAPPNDARLGREVPIAVDLGLDGAEAGVHGLADHAALELGKGARHVKEQLADRRGRG